MYRVTHASVYAEGHQDYDSYGDAAVGVIATADHMGWAALFTAADEGEFLTDDDIDIRFRIEKVQ